MLVLHDGNQIGPCDPFILQEMFGLTPAEADVAVLLTQGVAVAEIARRRQVSITTVRSQVSGLKAKTETKREADLVRRLLALPHAFSEC
jgi:DNA-binding CsgD family transcriptional regulator